jgi:hypothetical protein
LPTNFSLGKENACWENAIAKQIKELKAFGEYPFIKSLYFIA